MSKVSLPGNEKKRSILQRHEYLHELHEFHRARCCISVLLALEMHLWFIIAATTVHIVLSRRRVDRPFQILVQCAQGKLLVAFVGELETRRGD